MSEESNLVRLPHHSIALSEAQKAGIESYLASLRSNPYSPPTDAALSDDLLNLLVDEGRVVKLNDSVVYDAGAYGEMVRPLCPRSRSRARSTWARCGTGSRPAASTLCPCLSTWTSSASPAGSATTGC